MARLIRGIEIGRGGMATVHRAVNAEGRVVALKTLRPEIAAHAEVCARFMVEIRTLAGIRHPSVVHLEDYGETDGVPWFTMQLLDARPLNAILAAEGALAVPRALGLARQLAGALACCHASGVIHRDVKPANLMVDAREHLTLMDFGLARAGENNALTASGKLVGSPRYLPPEVLASEEPGPPTDVYAMGVTLYEMLTGRPAFRAATLYELIQKISGPGLAPLSSLRPDLDPRLSALVAQLTHRDPAARPTAAEVEQALQP